LKSNQNKKLSRNKTNYLIRSSTTKKINSELDKIKSYFYLISVDRVIDYNEWYKLGCLIKSLYFEDGLTLFLELSKKSKHYESNEYI